ncbi:MAG TPA: 30S ribosomal protein S17 [Nitrososphaeria archaeon]|nr:30S ribosomal protein S17 [Conexivisphaerales archaeon]PMP97333.1 MAG: 30S ribosomal protein S17 [Nitrososphaera sp.]HEU16455.1 30S ribosomal protein S17 [Nitrososphaeria archaeon]
MSTRTARNIGIQWIKPPTRSCDDDKCPWHGSLPVRGRVFEAKVVRFRARNLAVVERMYYQYQHKYMRYERRRSDLHAYVPSCLDIREGDTVFIGETRQLAKSVAFVVLGKSGGGS